ncbi:MAG: UTP--glucose-1-phosphate uridylyltransferase [Nocardioidaceae bacterium]
MTREALAESVEKMRGAGIAEPAIDAFRHYWEELAAGVSGLLPESQLEPVSDVPDAARLEVDEAAVGAALERAVVIKLNGGLGTSMGMTRAKSLLEVRDGLTFLDIIVRQVLELRRRTGARLPLVLMNSFHTRDDTLAALERYPDLESDLPPDFLQNREPKLRTDDLRPVAWPPDPSKEWCPPGHGDLYTALLTSGLLDAMLERGYEYAFVSNSDNLGALLEPRTLGWFAAERLPFAMEVCDRTEADRKGGHIAVRDGRLVLRESAQTPEEDLDAFADVNRHRFFNTNNLWLNLRTLADVMRERRNVLGLPMIVNEKTVDPGDKSSPRVHQLETAMGAAIAVFEGARAVRVERDRFAPVKTTDDLLALRSDVYVVTDEAHVVVSPERRLGPLLVELDPDHFKLLADFEARFPEGAPSLIDCERLSVRGDVRFGRDVVCRGRVELSADRDGQLAVPDGAVVESARAA